MLICALLMLLVVRRRERVMTVDAFITMALLASLSLVLFGAFPYHWEIGAVAVNTLNIVICAYCWYVIIAFTSFGTRDPYVYAMGGWVICFGSRSLWKPRTSGSSAKPKPMRPNRRQRWPKRRRHCKASCSTRQNARLLPSRRPPRL